MIPLSSLSMFCRVLRHNLGAGLSPVEVFRQQANRGTLAVRPIAGRVAERLQAGESLGAAFEHERANFPSLFLSMIHVGEETGHLPEIFGEMEKYYSLENKLRRQFIAQSILPVVQFIFAVFIVAGLIWILAVIGESRNPGQPPPALFGLRGRGGAMWFLIGVFGSIATLLFVYFFLKRRLRHLAGVEALLLRIPVIGTCLEAIAMSRLCLAMQLTLHSAMPIGNAMRLSLAATGNNAFSVHTDEVLAALVKGKTLTEALSLVRPLPAGFLDLVATAEEGGSVPEMMRHQAEFYQEESSRRLSALTQAANMMLYLVYAGCVIYAIFTIASIYLGALGV